MPGWMRWMLGLDAGEIPPGSVSRFELAGLPAGWWAVAAFLIVAACVALVVLIYRRESDLGTGRRLVLGGLRLVALAAVVLVLLNPRLNVEVQARRLAETLLLVDGSGSMGIRDRYGAEERHALWRATGLDPARESEAGGPSRSELVSAALAHSRLAARLGEKNRVRPFLIDEGIAAVEPEVLPEALKRAPESGRSTWLGSAVRSALDAARAAPVAAVVVISDGRQNGGDALAAAAADLQSRGVPVHALGIGRADVPRNLAVVEVNAPEVAETGMPIRIRIRVRGSGFPGEAEVKLSRARQGDRAFEPLGAETIELREYDGEAVVYLQDAPPRDGRYRYLASVEPRPGEESKRDNQKFADVVVASETCRVLLVGGGPTFEYRHLRNFFIRDGGIQVSTWLQSADPELPQEGDIRIQSLPTGEPDLRPYDVVMLLDPDPDSLPRGFLNALERFVTDLGGGLAFVAGEHYTKRLVATAEGARLGALLPVELGEGDPGHDHRRPWRPALTQAGKTHTLCQLRPRADENQKLWGFLPRFYFRFPVARLKPAASALWQAGTGALPTPAAPGEGTAAAVHQAGAGRVLFIATDDLYRWREYREDVHEQFWSGAARYLALGKRLAGTRQVAVSTDRERYLVGDEVRIEAHILDTGHEPLSTPRVAARIERQYAPHSATPGGGGEPEAESSSGDGPLPVESSAPAATFEVSLEAVPGRRGWFRGRWNGDAEGGYRVLLSDPGSEGTPADFQVARPSGESEDPSPDFAALADLAKRTGGSFAALSEIDKVAARIPDRTVVEVLGRKTRTVWDSAFLLLVFAGALIVEWTLRKRWQLC